MYTDTSHCFKDSGQGKTVNICRSPTIVRDQLRRGGKCAGLNSLRCMPNKDMYETQQPDLFLWEVSG